MGWFLRSSSVSLWTTTFFFILFPFLTRLRQMECREFVHSVFPWRETIPSWLEGMPSRPQHSLYFPSQLSIYKRMICWECFFITKILKARKNGLSLFFVSSSHFATLELHCTLYKKLQESYRFMRMSNWMREFLQFIFQTSLSGLNDSLIRACVLLSPSFSTYHENSSSFNFLLQLNLHDNVLFSSHLLQIYIWLNESVHFLSWFDQPDQ